MGMKDVEAYKDEKSRDNGWTLPPHPLQVAAWIVLILFAVFYFVCFVPALHQSWQPVGYIVPGLSLLAHLLCHIVGCTIDPADPSVLKKKYPKKRFDRTQHKHVIENCHCYICQVDVESKSKHCSICNKCVSEFDHHCKWLNNCVGGRNYRWFLATLVTAIIALLLTVVVALVEFIAYYTDQTNRAILQPYRDLNSSLEYTEAELTIFYQPVVHNGWLAMLGVYFILGIIAIGLLVHLFGFHLYLIHHKLSTYDYIVKQRDREKHTDDDNLSIASSGKRSKRNRIMPSSELSSNDKRKLSKDSVKPGLRSTTKDYQRILEEAESEQNRSPGETPPPSTSPIPMHETNNNCKLMNSQGDLYAEQLTAVKKLRRKKKKRSSNEDTTDSAISTVDNPKMYQNKGYTISHVDIPPIANPVRIMPPPIVTPRGTGVAGEYHSDSADSLLEVPTDKSLSFSMKGSDSALHDKKELKYMKKKPKMKKKRKEFETQSDDELNCRTVFTVNDSAKLNADGSIDYTDGFQTLPLTPTNIRKAHAQIDKPKVKEIPPLDLTGLRGSHESVSFQPYSATFRSTDTIVTDRLLPTLREERIKSTLKPVVDTEV
ncbi:palmitoyltransferase ZDHHC1-like [Mercenaria mercenaria]|uniref:palmitoyltransferase ZDHHC1-like n=1 Tax=Mercenaria mercenaria TaxID=6596 RepID=UPI00234F0307|nr:palmitoyltransferase ZDHHC1-like [Mercenaria mercenaria]XP_045193483.2 palmitoyltransferase ZDHHC1-like [Mercenaria mercenaria]